MKRVLWTVVVLLLLALDWAALHDILKGEPGPYGEYAVILLSMVVLGVVILMRMRGSRKRASCSHSPTNSTGLVATSDVLEMKGE